MGPRASIGSIVLACVGWAGCGGALVRGQVADLERQLAEAQRRAAARDQKLEELEDKVFLLTDQMESQKLAVSRSPPPRLPVVTLRPASAPAEEGADAPEFAGEARSPDTAHTRPSLHLDGARANANRKANADANASAGANAGAVPTENLGTAPAPPVPKNIARETRGHVVAEARPSSGDEGGRERPPLMNPLKLYRAAYESLRAGRHEEAERGFRDFVRRFPQHDYADNAQYWLGECFYDRKRFAEAAPEFRAVITRYPLGNKAPDALLKLGYCLVALGDAHKGHDLLAQIPEIYPGTEAARLAKERLAELAAGSVTGGTQ
jgi:tol-pal system protein YbgF